MRRELLTREVFTLVGVSDTTQEYKQTMESMYV